MEIIIPLFFKKIAPKRFNKFAFSSSRGALGGILVAWIDSLFRGSICEINPYSVTIVFSSRMVDASWKVSAIYGPCHGPARLEFTNWLSNLNISYSDNWMIMGDFNFYRSVSDRSRPGVTFQT
jgi:hypothetical protein